MLTALEKEHYSRHLRLPGFGEEKQVLLKTAKVLLIGAGGLGCPVGMYLAAAGVGTIGIADADVVERSNLHRQVAHSTETLGQLKTHSIIRLLQGLNPFVNFIPHALRLGEKNITRIIADYDLVIDGSDNFTTRFLVADACYLQDISLLQGAVYGYEGQFSLFKRGEHACMRCLFEVPPSENALAPCHEAGVLGVVPGAVGLLMATEAIKFLTKEASIAQGKMLRYDARTMALKHYKTTKNRDCPLCGAQPTIHSAKEIMLSCIVFPTEWEIAHSHALAKDALWLDVREQEEYSAGHMPDAKHFALSRLQTNEMPNIPKDAEIIVYCQAGKRSRKAVQLLRDHGFIRCYSLAGGYNMLCEQV